MKAGQYNNPPRWVDNFLDAVLKSRFADEVIGDLHEWFDWKQETLNGASLALHYAWAVITSLRWHKLKKIRFIIIHLIDFIMISNNIKISLRSLLQHKRFTLINIIGLTFSFVSFLYIYAYVQYERSYDNFHPKGDHIYRVIRHHIPSGNASQYTATPVAPAFLSNFGSRVQIARFGQDAVIVEAGDDSYYEAGFYWADTTLFEVFHLPFLYGSPTNALKDLNTIVLTQEVAEKYFGPGVDPVGQLLPVKVYDGNAELLMRVDGVLKALPPNTDLPFELLGSIGNALELYKQFNNNWDFFWLQTYAYVPNPADVPVIEAGVYDMIDGALGKKSAEMLTFTFQPLSDVHLHSARIRGGGSTSEAYQVITLSVIGVFIVLIATINYLNLMGASLNKRRKEVSVRKVMGATRRQMFGQFLTEATLTIVISLCLALIVAVVLWPYYTGFAGKPVPESILLNWPTALFLVAMVLVCGALSGIYPAWLLTSIPTTQLISAHQQKLRRNKGHRLLVAAQFAASVFLIAFALLIYRQVNFMATKDLGFNKEQLMSIKIEDRDLQQQVMDMKAAMQNVAGVASITASSESLPSAMNNGGAYWWDEDSKTRRPFVNLVAVDRDFFKTLEIPLLQGRDFLPGEVYGKGSPVILNQAAIANMERYNPLNNTIWVDGMEHQVIGVVADYHYQSLQNVVHPAVFFLGGESRMSPDNLIVRLGTGQLFRTINDLEDAWESFATKEFFSFQFVDASYQQVYNGERRFLRLFAFFALLSVVISCMGLYGLVLFTTEERSKEISIRKVLGSTAGQIMVLVARRFLVLIAAGFVLGIPLAVVFAYDWLSQFPYRIGIEAGIVAAAALIVLAIAAATIGFNTFKAAGSNPVKYLRNE